MSPRLRFLAPLVALAAATTISLASAQTIDGPRFPHITKRSKQTSVDPLRTSALGRLAAPASIQSAPELCGAWNELFGNEQAYWRSGHSTVYDSARDRLLVFGGAKMIPGVIPPSSIEVRALSLGASPALTVVEAQGGSASIGCYAASTIYDPVRDRLIVFGGYDVNNGITGGEGGTWTLGLSGTPTWQAMEITGSSPPNRAWHTAIYEVTRDRMILFGGNLAGGGDANDVWVLTFSGATGTWTQMSPSGTPPIARDAHTAVYDGPRDRMVVFGGWDGNSGTGLNDVHALSLAGSGAWSAISPNQGPPTARYGQNAIADVPRDRMLVFGGWDNDGNLLTDTWSLSFTNPVKWTDQSPTGETPEFWDYFGSIYDPVRQRMLSFIGDEFRALGNLGGTPAWSLLTPTGQIPRQRFGAAWIHDVSRQRLILYGGRTVPENKARDLWAFSLTAGTWSRIIPTGNGPGFRVDVPAIHDPAGDRMILFGGSDDFGVLNDTWQLSLAGTPAWTHLTPSGTPPPARSRHTAILDTPRSRMVVYGGADLGSSSLSDVWALSLSGGTSWSALSPTGGPVSARQAHTSIFDAPRNRMLTYGWNDATVSALALAGTPSWSTLSTTGTPPPFLAGHVAAYDASRDRMLLGMGEELGGGGLSNNAMYALELAGTPTWKAMGTSNTPAPRNPTTAVFDAGGDRMLLFGGNDYGTNYNDVLSLSFPNMYPLTVQASPPAGGSVQQIPTGICQAAGSMVELTAVPSPTYSFTGWSGDASGTANPITVTMSAAKNITASFDNFTLTVTVSPPAGGSVSKNPNLANYPPNSDVTLTATPSTGYSFSGWSGDASGTTNPVTVTMSASKSVTATFVGNAVNVTVSPAGAGSVTKNPNQAVYALGSQVTLTANSGYPFAGWSGDASGTTNPLTITVDGPKNITASFEAYTITTNANPAVGGSFNKTPFSTFYGPGAQVLVQAVPAAGYQFTSWSGDLTGTVNPQTLVMNGNKSVTADFILRTPECGGWSLVSVGSAPSGRRGTAAIWDPIRDRMVVVGGVQGFQPAPGTWALTLGATPTWTELVPGGTALQNSIGLYDPVRDRMISFGGIDGIGFPLTIAYALSLSSPSDWAQITTSGTPPQGRYEPGVIYDPPRDRIVLFGGRTRCGTGCTTPQNDVWQLTLAGTPTWTQLAPSGTPPPAGRSYATYDPVRERMVVMTETNAVWALSLSGTPTWTNLTPWGSPHANGPLVYDPVRDRVLLIVQNGSGKASALAFKEHPNPPLWAQVFPEGDLGSRTAPAVVYDPDDDLALLFGGSGQSIENLFNTTYRLDLSGGFFLDAGATNNGTVQYDDGGWCYPASATANLSGVSNPGYVFDEWLGDASGTSNPLQLTMDAYKVVRADFVQSTTDVEEPPVLAFALDVRPNPSVTAPSIQYALPKETRVRLRIFDVSGREVARLVDGSRPAGRHVATWTAAGGSRPPAGIYIVRLETLEGAWTKRLALLR